MTLREKLIEAMSQPIADEMYDVPQYYQKREYVAAANALDAILEELSEQPFGPVFTATDLIASLRDLTEEQQ